MDDPNPLIARELAKLYAALRGHFGYEPSWWPGSPWEITLTAILVQQSDWSAAWKGAQRLKEEDLLPIPHLARAEPERVQELIRGVAFAPTKAKRLVTVAGRLAADGHVSIDTYFARHSDAGSLRQKLRDWPGVGHETADCIVLFAAGRPAFVIDEYTRRIFRRLDLFPRLDEKLWNAPYLEVKAFFERHILADLSLYDRFAFPHGVPREVAVLRDWHAQLVELGKHHCLKHRPRCHAAGAQGWNGYSPCARHCQPEECRACPLAGVCAMGQSRRPKE
jgi:endonuclease-3 related protein